GSRRAAFVLCAVVVVLLGAARGGAAGGDVDRPAEAVTAFYLGERTAAVRRAAVSLPAVGFLVDDLVRLASGGRAGDGPGQRVAAVDGGGTAAGTGRRFVLEP